MANLVEPDLSYKLIGFCMKVHSELGKTCKEKYYQDALEILLEKEGINYKRELKTDLEFDGKKIGTYFLDFLVEGKIVLELKVRPGIGCNEIKQVSSYIKNNRMKLGIIVNFGGSSIEYKRILNPEIREISNN